MLIRNGVINATDVSAVKNAIGGSQLDYSLTDATLSNIFNATDVSLIKTTISSSGTGAYQREWLYKTVKTTYQTQSDRKSKLS
jgi:hypothetical protein